MLITPGATEGRATLLILSPARGDIIGIRIDEKYFL